MSLPARIGIPIVAKYSGVTTRIPTVWDSPLESFALLRAPAAVTGQIPPPGVIGSELTRAALDTPWRARIFERISAYKAVRVETNPYLYEGSDIWIVSTESGRNPGSIDWTRHRARVNRPAVTRRTIESEISTITKIERKRSRRPPIPDREPSRNPSIFTLLHARHAGKTPKTSPVASVTRLVNANTRGSSIVASVNGNRVVMIADNTGSRAAAIRIPINPPATASTTLSVSNCRIRRSRPAPIAARTVSSFRRAIALANRRLVKFVHAISSTQNDAPSEAQRSIRV